MKNLYLERSLIKKKEASAETRISAAKLCKSLWKVLTY